MVKFPGINSDKAFNIIESSQAAELPNHIAQQIPHNWFETLCYNQLKLDSSNNDILKNIEELTKRINQSDDTHDELIQQLKFIYARLTGLLDNQLGSLSNKMHSVCHAKLKEGFGGCVEGIEERTHYTIHLLASPNNIPELLSQVRHNIAQNAADKLTTTSHNNNIHRNTAMLLLAQKRGFGIQPPKSAGQFYSTRWLESEGGLDIINQTFAYYFQFYKWTDQLLDLFADTTLQPYYTGWKKDHTSYTDFDCQAICSNLGILLNDPYLIKVGRSMVDSIAVMILDEAQLIKDVNWAIIHYKLWQQLKSDGYINPFADYRQLNSDKQAYYQVIYHLLTLAKLKARFTQLADYFNDHSLSSQTQLNQQCLKGLHSEFHTLFRQLCHHQQSSTILQAALKYDDNNTDLIINGLFELINHIDKDYLKQLLDELSVITNFNNQTDCITAYHCYQICRNYLHYFNSEQLTDWLTNQSWQPDTYDSRIVYLKKHICDVDSMLHWALKNDNDSLFLTFLSTQQFDVNYRDDNGNTPLNRAISQGKLNLAELLIKEHHASIATENHQGIAPVDYLQIHHLLYSEQIKNNQKDADKDQRPIIKAIVDNTSLTELQTLISQKAEIAMITSEGKQPIHHAIAKRNANPDVVKLLIDNKISLYTQDNSGSTPLHWAVHKNHLQITQLLLDAEVPINIYNNKVHTPLHIAASKRDSAPIIQTIINECSDTQACLHAPDKHGFIPLHYAVVKNNREVIDKLIDCGTNIQFQAKNGQTALHLAAKKAKVEALGILIDNGAYLETPDDLGMTPLHMAAKYGSRDIAHELMSNCKNPKELLDQYTNEGFNPYHIAALEGNSHVIEKLAEYDSDLINHPTQNNEGKTALHLALHKGYLQIASTLIQVGADPTIKDAYSQSPLHYAALKGQEAIIDKLLTQQHTHTNQQQLEAINKHGETPLQLAVKQNNTETVTTLLNRKANPHSLNNKHQNALHIATKNGFSNLVDRLIETEESIALINTQDNDGSTPLHLAAQNNNIEPVKTLLPYTYNLDLRDREDMSWLDYIAQNGHFANFHLLTENYLKHDKISLDTATHAIALNIWQHVITPYLNKPLQQNIINQLQALNPKTSTRLTNFIKQRLKIQSDQQDYDFSSLHNAISGQLLQQTNQGYIDFSLSNDNQDLADNPSNPTYSIANNDHHFTVFEPNEPDNMALEKEAFPGNKHI